MVNDWWRYWISIYGLSIPHIHMCTDSNSNMKTYHKNTHTSAQQTVLEFKPLPLIVNIYTIPLMAKSQVHKKSWHNKTKVYDWWLGIESNKKSSRKDSLYSFPEVLEVLHISVPWKVRQKVIPPSNVQWISTKKCQRIILQTHSR